MNTGGTRSQAEREFMPRPTDAVSLTRGDIIWRRWLLALCAFGIVVELCTFVNAYRFYAAPSGYGTESTGTPFVDRVTYVTRDSVAAHAGLRVGDLIDFRAIAPAARYRFASPKIAGQPVTRNVIRGTERLTITYVPARWYVPWHAQFFVIGTLWALLFAAFLAWRRPESEEARVLCILLVLLYTSGQLSLELGAWVSPSIEAQIAGNVLGELLTHLAWPLLAVYALLFARPPNMLRRVLAALSWLTAAIACTYGLLTIAAWWSGFVDPMGPLLNGPFPATILGALEPLFPLLCAIATIAVVRGQERSRITWTLLTVGFPYVVAIATDLLALVPSVAQGLTLVQIQTVCVFIAPLGMTYALLNRRLLDVGFALNRAAIFAGVSFVLIGIFVLVEWLLADWLQSASRSANVAVTGALALCLGLSIRFVHARVEHVIDAVFFRKRREDEEAIRTFAREAPYITEKGILLERAAATLSKHADSSFVRILLADGSGTYGGVNENDPALVALRARHAVVDLHTVETKIDGEFAYPMVARGRLVGALVLGPKRSGESYAPDESSAIAQLAQSVAGALDVLAASTPGLAGSAVTLDAIYDAVEKLAAAVRGSIPA